MKDILYEYMSKFTSLSHKEQQTIVDSIVIEEYPTAYQKGGHCCRLFGVAIVSTRIRIAPNQ